MCGIFFLMFKFNFNSDDTSNQEDSRVELLEDQENIKLAEEILISEDKLKEIIQNIDSSHGWNAFISK